MTASARRPGRPRSTDADRAIFTQTLELLSEEGLRGLTVEKVAARAGVGKTTIYRRFPTKRDLIVGALRAVGGFQLPQLPDRGSVREDLRELGRRRIAVMRETGANTLMPRLVAESGSEPELHELIVRVFAMPMREAVAGAFRRGIERGEVRPDLDVEIATDLVAGAMVYWLMLNRGELRGLQRRLERVVELVLAGAERG